MSGTFSDPTVPNIADYTAFLQNQVGIGAAYLPPSSPWIPNTFNVAMAIVNDQLNCANPLIYTLAVYNLAADRLINFAVDVSGQTFFTALRQKLHLADFDPGVIQSSSDQGTSESMVVPEAMQALTLQDLQTLKTPWGRQYMAFAQMYGPTIWGLS